jgi:hypothetical protein
MAGVSARRGDREVFDIALTHGDGTPLDLTGKTVWMTVKDKAGGAVDDSDAIFKWYWVFGGSAVNLSVSSPSTGIITLTLAPSDSLGKEVGKSWQYDIQVLVGVNDIKTWDMGTFTFLPDITQRSTVP